MGVNEWAEVKEDKEVQEVKDDTFIRDEKSV